MESYEMNTAQPQPGVDNNFNTYLENRDIKHVSSSLEGDFKQDFSKDENEKRGNWSWRPDFLLACLSYCVDVSNIWRFPYLCYAYGGVAFLIPYFILWMFLGIPIFLLELALGQFTSSGPSKCWEMSPIFKGLGLGMVVLSGIVAIYYNMIIAWTLYYLFASFTSNLPWEKCHEDWAGPYCEDYLNYTTATDCVARGYIKAQNGVCYNPENSGGKVYGIWDKWVAWENGITVQTAADDYLERKVWHMHESEGIGDLGLVQWRLALCLLLAWIIVVLCLINGVKSYGKVVYFTALFPYIALTILLIRGLMLDGSKDGISYYLYDPQRLDWKGLTLVKHLKDPFIWKAAAGQILFSLSTSWGGLITLASYNRFHNDCVRDALIVCVMNCLTSIFAGFVVFLYIGFLAHELGTAVTYDVARPGLDLAFVVFPAAAVRMSLSPLWCILFFLLLLAAGLGTMLGLVETVITAIMDQLPRRLFKLKWMVVITCGSVFFLLGLPLSTEGGVYLLHLLDNSAAGWNVMIIGFLECMCVAYVYGFLRFKEDVRCMVGDKVCWCIPWEAVYPLWGVCLYFITPAGLLVFIILIMIDTEHFRLGTYVYPDWAIALGWLVTLAVVVAVFLPAIIMLLKENFRICRKNASPWSFLRLVKPSKSWGPALVKHRRLMGMYLKRDQFVLDPSSPSDPYDPSETVNPAASTSMTHAGNPHF